MKSFPWAHNNTLHYACGSWIYRRYRQTIVAAFQFFLSVIRSSAERHPISHNLKTDFFRAASFRLLSGISTFAFALLLTMGIAPSQLQAEDAADIPAYRQGVLHRSMGHRELALKYFNQALSQDSRDADMARLALLEMRMEEKGADANYRELLIGASFEFQPVLYRRAGFLLLDAGANQEALDLLLAYPDQFPDDPAAPGLLYQVGRYAQNHRKSYVAATLFYDLLERYPESDLADDTYILLARHYYLPGPDRNPDRSRDILIHFAAQTDIAFQQSPHAPAVRAYLAGKLDLNGLFSSLYFPAL